MQGTPVFNWDLLFLTYFHGSTTISCGVETGGANAYFLGKDVFEVGKHPLFRWQDNLMNRLIHRSWGEGFANISLDLSTATNDPQAADLISKRDVPRQL